MKTDVELQPLAVAKLLKAVVDKEQPQLCILGKQAIDDDANQTGQMLSALLGWSQATFASKLVINGDGTANVTREVDGGLETIQVKMPLVITTDLRLNEPRYASLPNITQLLKYSVELYDTLEQDTGLATGWKRNGGLRLACNAERMTEIKRQATTAHSFGLEG